MRGQILIAAFLACAAVACGGGEPRARGFVLGESSIDLGDRWAGEDIPLEFPFEIVGEGVVIESLLASCGCLGPEILVDGERVPFGQALPAGSRGTLRVLYRTAGFQGRKETGVEILGRGPGLPTRVEIDSWLKPWFVLEPQTLRFGTVDGAQPESRKVLVRGQAPFRLTRLVSGTPALEVVGVPSEQQAMEQELEIVLQPGQEEGRGAGFLRFETDQPGFLFTLACDWTTAGDLWLWPGRRMLLGQLRPGVEIFQAIEVGARVGTLKAPEVALEGLPGGEARVEIVDEGRRYRVNLKLIPEPGTLRGTVTLSLPYVVEGREETVERQVEVLAVVHETR